MRVHQLTAHLLFGALVSMCSMSAAHAALPVPGTIVSVHGEEAISTLYQFIIDIEAPNTNVALANIIDQPITFALTKQRNIHGTISSASVVGATKTGVLYRLVVKPKIAAGLLTSRKRVYQEMTAIDVTENIAQSLGITLTSIALGAYESQSVFFQYGESDWQFASRILSGSGIYYYFKHSTNSSQLVLSDNLAKIPALRNPLDMNRHSARLAFGLTNHSSQVQLNDYNFRAPDSNLLATASSPPYQSLVSEEYPGGYSQLSEGQAIARIRLDEKRSQAFTYQGSSTNARLTPGYSVKLTGHPLVQANQTYLITRVEHRLVGGKYSNQFEVVPTFVPYHPVRSTAKPFAVTETARVVGPAGEEIAVDEFARVLVRFVWQPNNASPIYARLLQFNSDSVQLPRIGEEVLVTFLDGDPSRPVVIGSLHNAQHKPPLKLPQYKYATVLSSKSHEIFMGDRQGEELLRLSSAKNLDTVATNLNAVAKNDQVQKIGRNQTISVGGNQKISVGRNGSINANTLTLTAKNRLVLGVGTQRIIITRDGITLPTPVKPKLTPKPRQRSSIVPNPQKK